jgi:hypothetical protein
MEVTMANERIVDQPVPISDEALNSAAGGSVDNAKLLAEMISNIQKTRSDIATQMVRNLRG